jgi:hypothetical protein
MKVIVKPFLFIICFISLTIFFASFSLASDFVSAAGWNDLSFPGPDLFSPVTDNVNLHGNPYLEFKWRQNNFVSTRYYIFRLYKGFDTITPNLILTKNVSSEEYPFKIEASFFELNQVYSWEVIQVLFSGRKSDKSFASFKITER